jgi:hypothetical protein
MFTNPVIAIIFGAMEFFLGALISLAITSVVYRRFLDRSLILRTMILGGLAFVLVMFLGGWAGDHATFQNGRLVDGGPAGGVLWLRNWISQYEGLLSAAASILAGSLSGLRVRSRNNAV